MAVQPALTEEQVAPLFSLLQDPDQELRIEALRALVHLPLTPKDWRRLGNYLLLMLGSTAVDAGSVATTLGISEEAVANLPPVPRPELIDTAVYAPLPAVRAHLRRLAGSDNVEDRWLAARALARAGDRSALPVLLEALRGADPDRRVEASMSLAALNVAGAQDAVHQLLAGESDPEICFGLALALARAGQRAPLSEMLRTGEIGYYWSIPSLADGMAASLPPFPETMRAWLKEHAGDESFTGATRDRALELWLAHEPAPEPPEQPAPAPAEQADAEEAAEKVLREVRGLLAGEVEDVSWHFEWQPLVAVSPETASRLVNTLWELILSDRDRYGIGLGNEVGLLVYNLQDPFTPEIPALFRLFVGAEEIDPHALEANQLAWLLSRTGLDEIVVALAPYLQADPARTRAWAARLVGLSARYADHSFPPLFGGGTLPASLPPSLDDLAAKEVEEVPGAPVEPGGEVIGSEFGEIDSETFTKGGFSFDFEEMEEAALPAAREGEPVARVVNTGFSSGESPGDLLNASQPLITGVDCFFWLQIGAPMAESIEIEPVSLPQVPDKTRLTVVLFPFRDGLEIRDGADIGELEVQGPAARVIRQPAEYPDNWPARDARLYFPVRVPAAPGTYRLRCNIYWGQLLLQSRLVTANAVAAGTTGEATERQLRADLDYTISNQLEPAHINRLEPEGISHRLSLMLNSNGDATHNVHVFGREGDTVVKKGDLQFGEMELAEMIENARQKLRLASWGHEAEYREEWDYLYGDVENELAAWRANEPGSDRFIKQLRHDLASMAKSGYRFYDKLKDELLDDDVEAFEKLLRQPAMLQVAFKRSIQHLLPAALVYDYRILSTLEPESFRLCSTFEAALREGADLSQTDCWQGECPQREAWDVVCPSGFWGFRHYLGMPLTLCDEQDSGDDGQPCPVPDPPAFISYDELRLGVGVATDLPLWGEHQQGLFRLQPEEHWLVIDDINKLLQTFDDPPHLLYFYCHGGLDDGAATLEFGPADPRARIDRTIWGHASWKSPRPLVFINGCHTTAVTPEKAMDLVEPLLRRAHSAGVVGTEVTIFEPLATRFAEACFRRFFAGRPIGHALRDARIELLQQGNPLGLVYIPFVLAGLRLRREQGEGQ